MRQADLITLPVERSGNPVQRVHVTHGLFRRSTCRRMAVVDKLSAFTPFGNFLLVLHAQ